MKFFNEDIIKKIDNYEVELPKDDWQILSEKLNSKKRKTLPMWLYAAAAGVTLLLGFGFIFFDFGTQTPQISQINPKNELKNQNKIDSAFVQNKSNDRMKITQNTHYADNNLTKNQQKYVLLNKTKNIVLNETEALVLSETEALEFQKNNIKNDVEQKTAPIVNQNKTEPIQQISIEDAEKLMNEKENQLKKSTENLTEKEKNQYYASLLASSSPTTFGKMESTPIRMLIPSLDGKSAILSNTYSKTKHDLPLTFGFTFGIPLAKRLYLNTGVQYTYIHSKTEKFDSETRDLLSRDNQNLHYLGIPVMLAYRIIDARIVKLYVSSGGAAEKGLVETHNQRDFKEINPENVTILTDNKNRKIAGFQFSLNANIGASVTLFKGLELYAEPGFAWYIPATKYPQPISRRTKNPFFISITAGLRFNFEK